MCTNPLKCYRLSKKLLRDYIETHHLWSFECINTIDNYELNKLQAINYKLKELWYAKEENHYKIKRICWNKRPKEFAEAYTLSEINCSKCEECKCRRASDWSLRCELETMYHKENCFITLTYNNQNLPDKRSLKMEDLQKFWKRLRRYLARQGKKEGRGETKIKYFACGEYG